MTTHSDVVIGIDYGSLSGRVVVVRVADGEELGTATLDYPHAVLDRALPASLAGTEVPLGHDWALQVPADYVEVLRSAVPRALAAAGVRAGPGGRDRHGLHRLHDGAHHRGRHPAERARGLPRRAARLRQALEAPRRPAARRPHQRARPQARGGLAAPLRRVDLLGVGVRQGTPAARGGPGRVRRDGALGRGRGLDRLAADRHLRPQRLHRRLQGHLPGRHLPDPGLPRRAEPRVR